MSRLKLALAATCVVALAVVMTAGRQPEAKPCEIQGTWRLVASTWGGDNLYTPSLTTTLLYNDTHWVSIAQETDKPGSDPILSVGGTYRIVGDTLHSVRTFGTRGDELQWGGSPCPVDGDVLRFKGAWLENETVQTYERLAPEVRAP
jgi:hypothetical protein